MRLPQESIDAFLKNKEFKAEELRKLNLVLWELEFHPQGSVESILCPYILAEKSILYHPRFVSIGPHHRQLPNVQPAERRKRSVLKFFFGDDRSVQSDCVKCLKNLEDQARKSYQRSDFLLCGNNFIEVLLLDSVFIIGVLVDCARANENDGFPPIPYFFPDFLLIENQVPFFVIKEIWDIMQAKVRENVGIDHDLSWILERTPFWKGGEAQERSLSVVHLLELYYKWNVPIKRRTSILTNRMFLPSLFRSWMPQMRYDRRALAIPSATELYEAGIQFKPKANSPNMFDISFESGILKIPTLALDMESMSLIANILSYEMSNDPWENTCVASYVFLMDSLINTKKDVALLRKFNILNNKLASDDEAASFINSIGESLRLSWTREMLNSTKNFYAQVLSDVRIYSSSKWRRNWTSLKHNYFGSPWTGVSVFAGATLLVLAFIQTYYTVFPRKT